MFAVAVSAHAITIGRASRAKRAGFTIEAAAIDAALVCVAVQIAAMIEHALAAHARIGRVDLTRAARAVTVHAAALMLGAKT